MGDSSNHSPVLGQSQQSSFATGIRDGWLPLRSHSPAGSGYRPMGRGLGWKGCDGICSNWSKYHDCRGSSRTLCSHPDCSCRFDAAPVWQTSIRPNHQSSGQAGFQPCELTTISMAQNHVPTCPTSVWWGFKLHYCWTFLRARCSNWSHSHVCTVNMKLQSAAD